MPCGLCVSPPISFSYWSLVGPGGGPVTPAGFGAREVWTPPPATGVCAALAAGGLAGARLAAGLSTVLAAGLSTALSTVLSAAAPAVAAAAFGLAAAPFTAGLAAAL